MRGPADSALFSNYTDQDLVTIGSLGTSSDSATSACHGRSKDNLVSAAAVPDHHPLGQHCPSVTSDVGSGEYRTSMEAETRPRLAWFLNRMLGEEGNTSKDSIDTGSALDKAATTIVHVVSPTDSLPGVALRYDTSVAALRWANGLWPSDSIHLRTELKIPTGRVKRKAADLSQSHMGLTSSTALHSRPSSSSAASTISAPSSACVLLDSERMNSGEHDKSCIPGPSRASVLRPAGHNSIQLSVLRNSASVLSGTSALPSFPSIESIGVLHTPCTNVLPVQSTPAHVCWDLTIPSIYVPVRTSQLEPEPAMELRRRRRDCR